jgi:XRE family aerobic/anaerobic benzoate catabolism transcriptional regulator
MKLKRRFTHLFVGPRGAVPGDSLPAAPAIVILGAKLRRARQRANLIQAELAQRGGLAQPAISLIEAGQANPIVQTLLQIADALGCPLAELLNAD